jgi:hypothetical protein
MSKRELIEPNPGDKRYVRRDDKGHFTEQVDVGKSLGRRPAPARQARRRSRPGRQGRSPEALGAAMPSSVIKAFAMTARPGPDHHLRQRARLCLSGRARRVAEGLRLAFAKGEYFNKAIRDRFVGARGPANLDLSSSLAAWRPR